LRDGLGCLSCHASGSRDNEIHRRPGLLRPLVVSKARPATEDAVILDTSEMSVGEAVKAAIAAVSARPGA
jgi:hypothetical protein